MPFGPRHARRRQAAAVGITILLLGPPVFAYDCLNLHARLVVERVNDYLETPAGGGLDCGTSPACLTDCTTDTIPNVASIQTSVAEADGCLGQTADACAVQHLMSAHSYLVDPMDKDFQYRLAPLCQDGSGNHDWTLDPATGIPPTCNAQAYVTCVDGTRPLYWADPGSAPGDGVHKWVFRFHGGSGNCRKLTRITPMSMADQCWEAALGPESATLSGLHEKKSINQTGLLDHNGGPPFAPWNRVDISACTEDRYTGNNQLVDQTLSDDGTVIQFINARGTRLVRGVLHDLAASATLGDTSFTVPRKVMPPLAAATDVLFAGSSAGAIGLSFTLDLYADEVRGIAPAALVLGLLDSRLMPGLDNEEAAFEDQMGVDDLYASRGNAFDLPPAGNSNSGDWSFGNASYAPGGPEYETYGNESWNTPWNQDCLAVHGLNPPGSLDTQQWRCRDQLHLAMNHLATPIFVAQSLRDANQEDALIEWADGLQTWQFLGTASCDRQRVQLSAYAALRDAHADGASRGAGPVGVWAPDFAAHEFFKGSGNDDCSFREVEVGGVTMEAALQAWIGGAPVVLIDGNPLTPGAAPTTDPGACVENNVDVTCRAACVTTTPPGEVSGLGSLAPLTFTDAATLDWEDAAPSFSDWFNLYRGNVTSLRSGDFGACGRAVLPDSTTTDADTPPSGVAWFYLVTGENCAGEGTLGNGSAGPRLNTAPCP